MNCPKCDSEKIHLFDDPVQPIEQCMDCGHYWYPYLEPPTLDHAREDWIEYGEAIWDDRR